MQNSILIFLSFFLLYSCQNDNQHKDNNENRGDGEMVLSQVFNISGATALMKAERVIKNGNGNEDILKYTEDGKFISIFSNINKNWHVKIGVLAKGPDGSIYIGLTNGIWIRDINSQNVSGKTPNFSYSPAGRNVALFRILKNGKTEVVDAEIEGMGAFYAGNEFNRQVIQFDAVGNVYYLGRQGQTSVLKKLDINGNITQIGNYRMSMRDFQIMKNGNVVFHGANQGNWNSEWLRVFYPSGRVDNIYYANADNGWFRTYFVDSLDRIVLIGENIRLENEVTSWSGIKRISVDSERIDSTLLLTDEDLRGEQYYLGGFEQLYLGGDGALFAYAHSGYWIDNNSYQDRLVKIIDADGNVVLRSTLPEGALDNKKLSQLQFINHAILMLTHSGSRSEIIKYNFDKDEIENISDPQSPGDIFSFAYLSKKDEIIYDTYDLSNNTSYLVHHSLLPYENNLVESVTSKSNVDFKITNILVL